MEFDEVINLLEENANYDDGKNLKHFAVDAPKSYGIRMSVLRKMAKDIGFNHELALKLWDYDYHECKLLATLIDEVELVTESQVDKWVLSTYSWDVCDQACINLYRKCDFAYDLIEKYHDADEEFVKRTAFSLIATLAVHEKKASDDVFIDFFPLIVSASDDNRNFVKKAVNWALRQIGKRNINLNSQCINLCNELLNLELTSANWIAKNALRELKSDKIQKKLK